MGCGLKDLSVIGFLGHVLSLLISCWHSEFNVNYKNTFHFYKIHLNSGKSYTDLKSGDVTGWLGSGKSTQELTFKLTYHYQEGVSDRKSRREFQSEGMANTKILRQERACLACRKMVPGEQNV